MRTVFLLLLIALAPLRGMANELMATRMATTLTVNVAAHHCEDMVSNATPEHAAPAAGHNGCENCSLCQMCASAALPAELQVALPVFGPQTPVPAHTDHFASALTALAQKPPIS